MLLDAQGHIRLADFGKILILFFFRLESFTNPGSCLRMGADGTVS
jgi:hypothetical protein